jgi:N-acetylglucosaminyldiphosphoundecaprenol N-acetyl-beta-D-mannosaminyltransferase
MRTGVAILGVPIDGVAMEQAVGRIEEFIRDRSFHEVATANLDFLVNAITNREYKDILCRCDLVLADGMPLILASRLLGHALPERVTGTDLVPRLATLSRDKGYGIFLLGARPEVSETAALALEKMGAHIVGRIAPPVRVLAEQDDEEILRAIEKANPDILLVAFGSPKQEFWIDRNRHRLHVPVCIGVGGALDFVSGSLPRAPRWMQKSCLEWLYRMWTEPRRLAPRYLKDAVCLAKFFSVQLAFHLVRPALRQELQVKVLTFGSIKVVIAQGTMTGPGLAAFERAALSATTKSEMLVVDMENVVGIGADGMQSVSRMYGNARKRNVRFRLTGLRPSVARSLRASRCEELTIPPVVAVTKPPRPRSLKSWFAAKPTQAPAVGTALRSRPFGNLAD